MQLLLKQSSSSREIAAGDDFESPGAVASTITDASARHDDVPGGPKSPDSVAARVAS
jgi:hypothetical protein